MKSAAIFGASGLIGGHLVQLLANHNEYQRIYAFARNESQYLPNKFEHIPFKSDSIVLPDGIDDVFVCLGTTMRKAGSRDNFLKVDFEMVVEIAKQSKAAMVKHFIVVSSLGADPSSNNFYLKTKGQMEEAVK